MKIDFKKYRYLSKDEIKKILPADIKKLQETPWGILIFLGSVFFDLVFLKIFGFIAGGSVKIDKNPDGSTNIKSFFETFLIAIVMLFLFFIYFKLTHQL